MNKKTAAFFKGYGSIIVFDDDWNDAPSTNTISDSWRGIGTYMNGAISSYEKKLENKSPKTKLKKDLIAQEDKLVHKIEELPLETRLKVISWISEFSGPIPHPSILKSYGEIIVDAPERILKMAEKDQDLRIEMSRGFKSYKDRGQLMAISVALLSFILTRFMVYINAPPFAYIIPGGTIATIVGAFIYGKTNNSDKNEK